MKIQKQDLFKGHGGTVVHQTVTHEAQQNYVRSAQRFERDFGRMGDLLKGRVLKVGTAQVLVR